MTHFHLQWGLVKDMNLSCVAREGHWRTYILSGCHVALTQGIEIQMPR